MISQFLQPTVTLEMMSHIAGVLGLLAMLVSGVLVWRKQLLRTGFDTFRDDYRRDMDEFKSHVLSLVNVFQHTTAATEQRHEDSMERILKMHEDTNRVVKEQKNLCEIIQRGRTIATKTEDNWKKSVDQHIEKMESNIVEIEKDVAYIKAKLNGKK